MVFLLVSLACFLKCLPFTVHKAAANGVTELHGVCLHLLPTEMVHADAIRALFCGEPLLDAKFREFLRASSLVHLFLLSGTQLFWLARCLRRCRVPGGCILALGTLWSLAGAWKVTFVRPLASLFLRTTTNRAETGWRADQRVLWSGLLVLAICPAWANSFSLIFGWTAALAFTTPVERGWRGNLQRAIWLWILLCPLLAFWNPSRPLGILVGLALGNLFFPPLLVTGFAAILYPRCVFLFDAVMKALEICARELPPALEIENPRTASLEFAWAWVIFLQGTWHFRAVRRARRGS